MNIAILSCIVVITVVFLFLSLEFIDTLKQVKKTSEEIEKLAYNANQKLEEIEPAFKTVGSVSSTLLGGWGKIIEVFLSLFKKG